MGDGWNKSTLLRPDLKNLHPDQAQGISLVQSPSEGNWNLPRGHLNFEVTVTQGFLLNEVDGHNTIAVILQHLQGCPQPSERTRGICKGSVRNPAEDEQFVLDEIRAAHKNSGPRRTFGAQAYTLARWCVDRMQPDARGSGQPRAEL
jgi:hypothetical protein